MAEVHKMFLESRTEGRAWVWACPTCGRRMTIVSHPFWKRTILDRGDVNAVHVSVANSRPLVPDIPIRVQDSDMEWLASVGIAWE